MHFKLLLDKYRLSFFLLLRKRGEGSRYYLDVEGIRVGDIRWCIAHHVPFGGGGRGPILACGVWVAAWKVFWGMLWEVVCSNFNVVVSNMFMLFVEMLNKVIIVLLMLLLLLVLLLFI